MRGIISTEYMTRYWLERAGLYQRFSSSELPLSLATEYNTCITTLPYLHPRRFD